jgi:hypothetical protein
MSNYLICENPKCHMVLDRRENGGTRLSLGTVLEECPECGDHWSASCPFCGQSLEVNWLGGHPHCSECCEKLIARTRAASSEQKNKKRVIDRGHPFTTTAPGKITAASA